MQERISKVAHEYAGRKLTVGEVFECAPRDVKLLLALGRIEPEEGEPGYVERDMTAGNAGEYRTRDMNAGTLHLNRKKHKAI